MPAEQDDPTGADRQEWTDLAANVPGMGVFHEATLRRHRDGQQPADPGRSGEGGVQRRADARPVHYRVGVGAAATALTAVACAALGATA